jgi:hypothetical protein
MLCVERRERTCGACGCIRLGEEEVERPGTLERRREGGVREVCTRLEELISSASSLLARDMFLNLLRLMTLL